ncbi:MAG: VCBS repeat-containing protein [Planctomycetes bacterium]|nr:VCBS repeat-containing protein [Planctomycetota bacterium]
MSAQTRTLLLASLGLPFAACGGGGGSAPPAPPVGFAAPEFQTTGGANGRSLAVADLDHDGALDVLVANETFASLSLLKGRADGSLATGVLLPAMPLVAALAVGDVDGDRRLDLVAASGASGGAAVLRGTGGGSFGSAESFALPWAARKLWLVDWTGDGKNDLLAASAQTAEIALLPGNGAGGFVAATFVSLAFAPADFVVVDTNGDRRPDLVCTGIGVQRIDTLRNDGAGGFLPAIASTAPAQGGRLVAGDLDGDRIADVVALDAARTAVLVCRGDGSGSFAAGSPVALGANATSLALGDLDGDGRTDLVAAAGTLLFACYGAATGVLGAAQALHSDALGATWVAAADVRGDGSVDVLYVSGTDRIGLLRNSRPAPAGLASYGTGTPDCQGRIGMWANGSPRLGNAAFGYRTTNAPADAFGVLLQGGPADVPGSDPLGIGALLHVGFGALTSRFVFSDPQGQSFMSEPVPTTPGLVGLPIYVQTLWRADLSRTCSTSPAGYATSAGLTSTIQP